MLSTVCICLPLEKRLNTKTLQHDKNYFDWLVEYLNVYEPMANARSKRQVVEPQRIPLVDDIIPELSLEGRIPFYESKEAQAVLEKMIEFRQLYGIGDIIDRFGRSVDKKLKSKPAPGVPLGSVLNNPVVQSILQRYRQGQQLYGVGDVNDIYGRSVDKRHRNKKIPLQRQES